MFDVLTYEKGASVLRMLEQYLGAAAFRDGIRLYLKRHEFGNAETTDLWDALEDSTKQPVRALMDSWIFQPGYPLISVEREGRNLVIAQQLFRYLQDGDIPDRKYHVPVFVRAGTKGAVVEKTLLLTDRELRLAFSDDIEWAVVNAGGHGFYRVSYGRVLLGALKQGLQVNLSAVERFGLVNDGWAATLAGLTPLPEYLDLVDLLRDENDINVWTTLIGSFYHLRRILDEPQCVVLQERLRAVLRPALERVGWTPKEGEPALVSQLRGDLINALGVGGEDRACQEQARELYALYEKNADAVERNLVPALVSIVAHTGNAADYEKFYNKYKSAKTPQEETRYLFALGAFRQPELIDRTLKMTVSGEVRTQNSPYLMRGILFNKDARDNAWAFMKSQWEEMLRQYPDNSIPRMCEGIIGLVSAELETDVKQFFAQHPVKQGAKQIEQHLERLRIAVASQARWKGLLRS
jgi:puromycin-sensitive aminopeptidase